MARSVMNFNTEAIRGGKAGAVQYCSSWQRELTTAGAMLAAEYAAKRIDAGTYNARMQEINRQTKDLNTCIASCNKMKG